MHTGASRAFVGYLAREAPRASSGAGHLLVRERLTHAFNRPPAFVAMLLVRAIGNVWPTSRRMVERADTCLLGRCAAGGHDIRHSVGCPMLRLFIDGRKMPVSSGLCKDRCESRFAIL